MVVGIAATAGFVAGPGRYAVADIGLATAGIAGRSVRVQGTVVDMLPLLEEPPVRLRVQQELLRRLAFSYGSIAPPDLGSMDDGKQETTEEKHYGKEPSRGLLSLHLLHLLFGSRGFRLISCFYKLHRHRLKCYQPFSCHLGSRKRNYFVHMG